MPPEITSPPSLDGASSLERMADQEAREILTASTASPVSSARDAGGKTGTSTACVSLSTTPPAHAGATSSNVATTEPTFDTMVRKGNRTVAVGDWGYPGYLTKKEWEVFVSYF